MMLANEESVQRDLSWFALTVRPQHEKKTARVLSGKGLEDFLPLYRQKRRWSDRIKEIESPLFPGYVFCRFQYENRMSVLTTPGVTSIVGFGATPAPVADAEIRAIQDMIASELPLLPWPFLKVGQAVCIDYGPLSGLEGILVQVKASWRVVVSVPLLQRSVAVEVDREMVSAVSNATMPSTGVYLPRNVSVSGFHGYPQT